MQLVRWSPFAEFDAIERRMRRLLDGVEEAPATLPAVDVYETDDDLVFELEVPGFVEKQLTVEVGDHTLSVKGEREEAKEEMEQTFHLRERLATRFERRFALPPEVFGDKVFAEFEAGVLTVHAPKAKAVESRPVTITAK